VLTRADAGEQLGWDAARRAREAAAFRAEAAAEGVVVDVAVGQPGA
jgi:hypothetical protein